MDAATKLKRTAKRALSAAGVTDLVHHRRAEQAFRTQFVGLQEQLPADERSSNLRMCPRGRSRAEQYMRMMADIEISLDPGARFQAWLDTGLCFENHLTVPGNFPPDYAEVIFSSLSDMVGRRRGVSNAVARDQIELLQAISAYVDRIIAAIDGMVPDEASERLTQTREYFARLKDAPSASLEEALQRILFFSSLLWQSRHLLVGLGRLDKLLAALPAPDDDDEVIELLRDFYQALHRYYRFKSAVMPGDTGQIMVLGGLELGGGYFCNRLTYLFIRTLYEHPLPEPKILLRVARTMPDDLLELAVRCIATGVGSPVLANDEQVIPVLASRGYTPEDSYGYAVSACWEPLAYGRSWAQNNHYDLNFAHALDLLLSNPDFDALKSFDAVVDAYCAQLDGVLANLLDPIADPVRWELDPLLSMFVEGPLDTGRDITEGGAIYNDSGMITAGLANVVDSLFNIRRLAFGDAPTCTLAQLRTAAGDDFTAEPGLAADLAAHRRFGHDDPDIIALTRRIAERVERVCETRRNRFGEPVAWGYSSPNYLSDGLQTRATLDGRHAGAPLSVHISSSDGAAYTELVRFAAAIGGEGCCANGNVVDFFVAPSLIERNFDKFVQFIRLGMGAGFYEMQMNVASSATLIDAKAHPERHPALIVRVWGFSAYFCDLPEEYQDVLIKRALASEQAV